MSTIRANAILDSAGGNTATINGTTPGQVNYQVFTASGTWTKPSGVTMVYVEVIGGGRSGDAYRFVNGTASGGAGGNAAFRLFRAGDIPASVTVTVGAGGAAVSVSSDISVGGLNGGASSFGTLLSSAAPPNGPVFTNVGGTGGSAVFTGSVLISPETSVFGGSGGAATVGTGTRTATNGVAPGGGGGAALITNQVGTATSGAGARGEVRVWAW